MIHSPMHLLGLLTTFALTSSGVAQFAGFEPHQEMAVAGPEDVAVEDFNNDGKLDIIVGHYGGVSIFLGNGNGTFASGQHVSDSGFIAIRVAPADLNGDGKMDLAVTTEDPFRLLVFVGNGDGTFQDPSLVASSEIIWWTLKTGDLNGDGHVDLVGGAHADVFLNNGDGTFLPSPSSPSLVGVPGIGDLNGDGLPDLVTRAGTPPVAHSQFGHGDGTFSITGSFPIPMEYSMAHVLADFDGDGLDDLAATGYVDSSGAYYRGVISIMANQGTGDFIHTGTVDLGAYAYQPALVAADIDKDGAIDLLSVDTESDSLRVAMGNGDGTFQPALVYDTGAVPVELAVGDLNGDGAPDVVTANLNSGTVSVLISRSAPDLNNDGVIDVSDLLSLLSAWGPCPRSGACTADFDGDGMVDVSDLLVLLSSWK